MESIMSREVSHTHFLQSLRCEPDTIRYDKVNASLDLELT